MKLVKHIANLGYGSRKDVQWMFREGRITDAAGEVLYADDPLDHDNVRVDGFEGRITDIRTRYTVIRAANGRESIVPNETLITQRVENLTDADQKFNLTTNIVVAADCNVAQVQQILKGAATSQPRVLSKPEPSALLVNFAADGLEFSLSFYINDPINGQANIKSAVNIAVLEGLRAAGIDIPFPQRVLHIPNNAVGAITAAQG